MDIDELPESIRDAYNAIHSGDLEYHIWAHDFLWLVNRELAALRSPAPAATDKNSDVDGVGILKDDRWWREYIDLTWRKAEEYSGGDPEKFIRFLAGAMPGKTTPDDLAWASEVAKRLGVGTPSAVDAPAATVTGWRLLEHGEILQDGDEWKNEDGTWSPNVFHGDKLLLEGAIVRRRLPPPAQWDEMRAAEVKSLAD